MQGSQELHGKVTFITGASRGIGRAIAESFAARGAEIAAFARSRADLESLAKAIKDRGGRCLALVGDVTDPQDLTRAKNRIHHEFGSVDVLVNNAGIVLRKKFGEISHEDWDTVMKVNVCGPALTTQTFLSDLTARRGRIINIASIAGRQGTPLLSAYCASKHALVGLTRALASELQEDGVTVNAICPGSVNTEMLRVGLPGTDPKMEPTDIAQTAVFLAGNAPSALTGACIDVFG